MKKKFYISINVKKEKDRGAYGKARRDVDFTLEKLNYRKVGINFSMIQNKLLRKCKLAFVMEYFCDFMNWLKIYFSVANNSIVVYQHPMQSSIIVYYALRLLKKIKRVKVIALIHDLYTFRDGKANNNFYRKMKDIGLLNAMDVIICHNKCMKNLLMQQGISSEKIISLNVFDYIHNNNLEILRTWNKNENIKVCIAGNLSRSKAGYIYKLNNIANNVEFDLFGNEYYPLKGEESINIKYMGSFPPEKLPNELTQHFGLVWDGDIINGCSGNTGKYMMINNPHKVSLYLSSGLPVIVWDKSAMADFVKDNGVGFAVSELAEINEIADEMTLDKYESILRNVDRVSEKLKNGEYTKSAIKKAEELLGEE